MLAPRLEVVLLAGFGSMMVLTGILGFTQSRRSGERQRELIAAQEEYARTDALIAGLRADLYRINLDLRDYLLYRDAEDAAAMKAEILASRERILSSLVELEKALARSADPESLKDLRGRVENYLTLLGPPLAWGLDVKLALGGTYSRKVLLSKRGEIGALSEQLQAINLTRLRRAQERLLESQAAFRSWLDRMTYGVLALSGVIAAFSVWWIFRLETRARAAERELRNLSQKLVQAQEEERKRLSLELHDQVGQMLTALRVEISNLGRIGPGDAERFKSHVQQAKEVAEGAMKTVRDLAMGLRPSMLDDLGLGAAVGWLGREFSRLSGVPADVRIEGALDTLTDLQKTSLFRIVQEAFTNIIRHAGAKEVSVELVAGAEQVELTIRDDGKGLPAAMKRQGLGLLGMAERVRELGGVFEIESAPGQGTCLRARIPKVAQ
jgi:signal transduction histidine kinase